MIVLILDGTSTCMSTMQTDSMAVMLTVAHSNKVSWLSDHVLKMPKASIYCSCCEGKGIAEHPESKPGLHTKLHDPNRNN